MHWHACVSGVTTFSYYFYKMVAGPHKCRDKAVDPNQRQCVLKEHRFKQFCSI